MAEIKTKFDDPFLLHCSQTGLLLLYCIASFDDPFLLHCSQTGEVGGMRQRSLMILFICTASSNKVLTKSSLCDCTVCAT